MTHQIHQKICNHRPNGSNAVAAECLSIYPASGVSRPKPSKTDAEMAPTARPLSPQPTTMKHSRRHGAAEARESCRKRHSPPSSRGTRSRGGDSKAGGERGGWKRAEHVGARGGGCGWESARPLGVVGICAVSASGGRGRLCGARVFPSFRLRGA